MSVPACGRWRGQTSSIASSPSSSSFRARNTTPTCARASLPSWRRSTRGRLAASYVSFPEGPLARVHYIIGRYEGKTPVVERATLEAGISAIAATWGDKLKAALAASTDGMRARMLANRYAQAFTGGYTEAFGARTGDRRYRRHRKAHACASGDDFGLPLRGRRRSKALRPEGLLARRTAVAVLSRAGDRKSRPARGQRTHLSDRAPRHAGAGAGMAARYDDRDQPTASRSRSARNSTIASKPRSWRWSAIAPNPTDTTA